MSTALTQPGKARRIRLALGLLLFATVTAEMSYGGEPGKDEYPHVASALVSTTGVVRPRQTAFQLWRHGFLWGQGDLKLYRRLDPDLRRAPGSMLEVWETQPDLRGKHVLRLRTAYEWKMSMPGMLPSRCQDLVWLGNPKQLWLFTCECVRKEVEIRAYRIGLDKTIKSGAKMGTAHTRPRAKWPKPARATAVHAWKRQREPSFTQMTAVVDGTSRIILALRARGGSVQWVSYDPMVRKPDERWKVGVELW